MKPKPIRVTYGKPTKQQKQAFERAVKKMLKGKRP
jgi:hypothetical protein